MPDYIDTETEQERPEWLPEKFKQAEDMLESYVALERRLTAQGAELRELRQQFETSSSAVEDYDDESDLAAAQAAEPYAQSVADTINHSEPAQQQARMNESLDNVDAMKFLADAAAMARMKVDEQIGQQVGVIPQPEQVAFTVASNAWNMMQQTPGFDPEDGQRIADELQRNPVMAQATEQALASGNPAAVVTAFSGALNAAHARGRAQDSRDALHAMKLDAQTLSGSQGRPEATEADATEWAKIVNAPVKPHGY